MFSPNHAMATSPDAAAAADDSAARDLAFLAAWEDDALPRQIDAGTILRIRQIRRAGVLPVKKEAALFQNKRAKGYQPFGPRLQFNNI